MIENVIIMGAAGRDFHNFNIYFKDNPRYEVIAFTAAQIPTIDERRYPPELSGKLYPEGVPIHPEDNLTDLIRQHQVDLVAFSYSDVTHVEVMHKASKAMAEGSTSSPSLARTSASVGTRSNLSLAASDRLSLSRSSLEVT